MAIEVGPFRASYRALASIRIARRWAASWLSPGGFCESTKPPFISACYKALGGLAETTITHFEDLEPQN